MKMRNSFSVPFALLALAFGPGVQAQNTVTLVGATGNSCSYTSGTVSAGGVLTFQCSTAAPVAPTCTLSATQMSVSPGGTSMLTANCTPGPITGYQWTNANAGPTPPAGASATLTFPTAGAFTYSVAATNATGTGTASADVTITVAAPTAPPTCTPTAVPATVTTGQSTTLNANCSNGATTWTWTTPSGAPAMSNTASATIGPFATAGTYTYSVIGTNSVGPSLSANVSVTVNAPTGGGSCATPAIAPKGFPNGSYPNINNMKMDIPRGFGNSAAAKFTVAATTTFNITSVPATSSETPTGNDVQEVVSLCPGDFVNPVYNVDAVTGATTTSPCSIHLNKIGSTMACTLPPGTYYLNVRHVKLSNKAVDSCPATAIYGYCSHWINMTLPQ